MISVLFLYKSFVKILNCDFKILKLIISTVPWFPVNYLNIISPNSLSLIICYVVTVFRWSMIPWSPKYSHPVMYHQLLRRNYSTDIAVVGDLSGIQHLLISLFELELLLLHVITEYRSLLYERCLLLCGRDLDLSHLLLSPFFLRISFVSVWTESSKSRVRSVESTHIGSLMKFSRECIYS